MSTTGNEQDHARLDDTMVLTKDTAANVEDADKALAHEEPTKMIRKSVASFTSVAPELVLQVFQTLWATDDAVSSICLGLTCRYFQRLHVTGPINMRRCNYKKRSYRALTAEEQAAHTMGLIVVFDRKRELLNPRSNAQLPRNSHHPYWMTFQELDAVGKLTDRNARNALLFRRGSSNVYGHQNIGLTAKTLQSVCWDTVEYKSVHFLRILLSATGRLKPDRRCLRNHHLSFEKWAKLRNEILEPLE